MKGVAFVLMALIASGGVAADEARAPFPNAREENLTGLFGFRRESLGDQFLADIILEEDVVRAIVVANTTSAPNQIHLAKLSQLIKTNPKMSSLWSTDENTGEQTRNTQHDYIIPFFMVVLEDKTGGVVGILFARNVVKVATRNGQGIIEMPTTPTAP